jgi:hypothetical protein
MITDVRAQVDRIRAKASEWHSPKQRDMTRCKSVIVWEFFRVWHRVSEPRQSRLAWLTTHQSGESIPFLGSLPNR